VGRIADAWQALTGDTTKATLPAGSVVQTESQIASASGGLQGTPLARDGQWATVPFAPGQPLLPGLVNRPGAEGRAQPRRYEYPVAWNVQVAQSRDVPFTLLRSVADQCDLVRRCIEFVKSSIASMVLDVSLSTDATQRILSETSTSSHVAAAAQARQSLTPEIQRIKDFWLMPDRVNGLNTSAWVSVLLEEVLVLDAPAIYPQMNVAGGMHSLIVLDGSTIKPLLDEYGNRPQPPYPAFQQILYGFPRGEFTASTDPNGQFTVDDLVYSPKWPRTTSPYGVSPVERCLPLADLYMKRQQWLRSEFNDGVTPELFFRTDANFGNNPDLLRGFENVFNDELSGSTERRHRARVLPAGFDPFQPAGYDQKFKSDLDEQVVKDLVGHFGLMPTQIGYTPKTGLGGAGHDQSESDTSQTVGIQPIILWLVALLNDLSRRFLGMDPDLTIVLSPQAAADEQKQAATWQTRTSTGQSTFNEMRAATGQPLYDFPEADMPLIITPTSVTALNGATMQAPAPSPSNNPTPPIDVPPAPPQPPQKATSKASDPSKPYGNVVYADPGYQKDGHKRYPIDTKRHALAAWSYINQPSNASAYTPQQLGQVRKRIINALRQFGVTPSASKQVAAELGQFIRWADTPRQRDFIFTQVDPSLALTLNGLVKTDRAAAIDYARTSDAWSRDDVAGPPSAKQARGNVRAEAAGFRWFERASTRL
jgi:hypothetical protein